MMPTFSIPSTTDVPWEPLHLVDLARQNKIREAPNSNMHCAMPKIPQMKSVKKKRERFNYCLEIPHTKKTASLMKPEVSSSSTREKNTKNKACPQSTNKTKNGSSTVVHAVKQWFNQKSTKQTLWTNLPNENAQTENRLHTASKACLQKGNHCEASQPHAPTGTSPTWLTFTRLMNATPKLPSITCSEHCQDVSANTALGKGGEAEVSKWPINGASRFRAKPEDSL